MDGVISTSRLGNTDIETAASLRRGGRTVGFCRPVSAYLTLESHIASMKLTYPTQETMHLR